MRLDGPIAGYGRISDDKEGRAAGVERQEADVRAFARSELGGELSEWYCDNDISASTLSDRPRPEFEAMLDAVERGDVKVIVAYSASRLTRRPEEWERLFKLHKRRGVAIYTSKHGKVDMATARGRRRARDDASRDAEYAEEIGELVAAAAKQRAERGEWHGGRPPCGYRYALDDRGRIAGLEPDPERAPVIREMAQRVLDGDTLYAMCRDLNRRGLRTPPNAKDPDGSMWRSQGLKRALTNPAVVGMREHNGDLHQGTWPAILDRQTWERVRDVLLDPERTDPTRSWVQDTSRKRALSGLMVCGAKHRDGSACGSTLVSQPSAGVPTMICHTQATGGCGHLRINYEPVEKWVTRQLVARLDTDEMRKALADAADETTVSEEAELRRSIKADQLRLAKLEDQLVDGLLSAQGFRRQRDRLNERIESARRELASLAGQRRRVDVVSGQDLADRLASASVEQQRALLSMFIEKLVIAPHPKGVPTNVTKRKTETDQQFADRLAELRESTLVARVKVKWCQ